MEVLNFKKSTVYELFLSWLVLVSYLKHLWQFQNKSDVLICFSLKALYTFHNYIYSGIDFYICGEIEGQDYFLV